jgi:predicted ATPase
MPVDHSRTVEASGGHLAKALRASWLPKLTNGWFFKAENFFPVARYLDRAALEAGGVPPDFLSHSHGEGFPRFFKSTVAGRGSTSSMNLRGPIPVPLELLKPLRRMDRSTICQVIMATYSPLLMAYPGARLLRISKYGLGPVSLSPSSRVLYQFNRLHRLDDGRLSIRHLSSNAEDDPIAEDRVFGFSG